MDEMTYVPHLCFGGRFGEFRWSIIHLAVLAIFLNFREKMSSINQVRLLISKFFQGGKNDQYSEGSERIVASNINEEICPVKLTLNYFQFLGPSYSGCLFPLCTAKNVPNPFKPVPYSSALSDLKKLLQSLGCDSKLYGEHSGKIGGATVAATHCATESQLKRL
jgi:hypothetical protein